MQFRDYYILIYLKKIYRSFKNNFIINQIITVQETAVKNTTKIAQLQPCKKKNLLTYITFDNINFVLLILNKWKCEHPL